MNDPSLVTDIYKQCHEHLRETDSKRNQLIAFYAVLVTGGLLGVMDKLEKTHPEADLLLTVTVGIAIVGFFCVLVLLNYRYWHTVYVNYIAALQQVMLTDGKPTQDAVAMAWNNTQASPGLGKELLSVEFLIFNIFLIFSFLPWQMAIQLTHGLIILDSFMFAFGTNLLLYIIVWNFFGFLLLKKGKQIKTDAWIYRGLPQESPHD